MMSTINASGGVASLARPRSTLSSYSSLVSDVAAVCNLVIGAIIEEWTATPNGASAAATSSRRALEQVSKNISDSLFSAYTLVADRAAHLHPSHIAVALTTVAMARAALAILRMRFTILRAIQLTLLAALILRPNKTNTTAAPPAVAPAMPAVKPVGAAAAAAATAAAVSGASAVETLAPHGVSGGAALVTFSERRAPSRMKNAAALFAQSSAVMAECALLIRERITDADVIVKRIGRIISAQKRSRL